MYIYMHLFIYLFFFKNSIYLFIDLFMYLFGSLVLKYVTRPATNRGQDPQLGLYLSWPLERLR